MHHERAMPGGHGGFVVLVNVPDVASAVTSASTAAPAKAGAQDLAYPRSLDSSLRWNDDGGDGWNDGLHNNRTTLTGVLTAVKLPFYLCLALLLAACQTVTPPDPASAAQPETPTAWRNAPASVAVPGEFRAAPADLRSWWRALDDARLDALIERALAQNLSLAQAEARIRQSRTLLGHAGDAYLPSLRLFTGNAESADSRMAFFQYGLDASWEISLFGRRDGELRLAQAQLGTAEASAQAVRVSLVAEVARTWVELCAAHRALALQRQTVTLDQQRTALVQERHTLGLSSAAEAAQARARQAREAAQLPLRQLDIEQTAQRLALLLGQTSPDAAWLNGDGRLPHPGEQIALDAVPADLLRTRPDILLAETEVLRAASELGIARSQLYPRLTIGAGYLMSTLINGSNFFKGSDTHGSFYAGPIIDLPLFDWGRRQALARAQDEALQAALLGYRQSVLTAVAETENALSALARQQQRTVQLHRALVEGEQQRKAQRTLRGLGLS